MPRPHHPRAKRRAKERRDRDTRRRAHQEGQLEAGISWQDSLSKRPLLRYRTQFILDDVITAIKMMSCEDTWASRQVTFQDDSYPWQEEIRCTFRIEYQKPGRYSADPKNRITVNQIAGRVISGPTYTTVEFRSSFTEWERSAPLMLLGGSALMFLIWIASMDTYMPCFNGIMLLWLVLIGICTVSLNYRERHPTHDQGMGAVLKTLKAVKLEEPAAKLKYSDADKSKIEEV
jgi:hypothetical protein